MGEYSVKLDLEYCDMNTCSTTAITVTFRPPFVGSSYAPRPRVNITLDDQETKDMLERLKQKAIEELSRGEGILL